MTAVTAGTWLFVLTIACTMITYLILLASTREDVAESVRAMERALLNPYWRIIVCAIAAFFSASLLWTFFRLRSLQKAMTIAVGADYLDSYWSFGQIVGAIVFIPAALEVLCLVNWVDCFVTFGGVLLWISFSCQRIWEGYRTRRSNISTNRT